MCDDAYEYDSSDAIQVEEEAYDTTLKGLFQLNFGANNTSSGPVITQDSNGDIRLGGLASVNGMGTCWAMSVQYMIDGKNLSMIPSGAISILSFNNLKRVNSSQECIAFPESFIYNIHILNGLRPVLEDYNQYSQVQAQIKKLTVQREKLIAQRKGTPILQIRRRNECLRTLNSLLNRLRAASAARRIC